MARRPLTGVLLVGGASTRFGSPKAHALYAGETLAERAWRVLGDACDERIAVGKRGELELPFEVLDDESDVRAPIVGIVAGLRVATHDVSVFMPVDAPLVDAAVVLALGEACRDAAAGEIPLPAAFAKHTLPLLERRVTANDLALKDALAALDTARVDVDPRLIRDADTPAELEALR